MTVSRSLFFGSLLILSLNGCHESLQQRPTAIPGELPPALSLHEIVEHPAIQRAIQLYERAPDHKAIAISQSGLWAIAEDGNSPEWVTWRALYDCGQKLKISKARKKVRGCFLYRLNDQQFNTPTQQTLKEFLLSSRRPLQYTLNNLGHSAREAYAKYRASGAGRNAAFAVSPGGGWGYSVDFTSPDEAVERAINLCDNSLSFSDATCSLYSLNGEIVQSP